MSYEPRGKMIDLMAKVQAAPDRVFSMKEISEILGCKAYRSSVDQYVYAANAAGLIFKREVEEVMYYAGVAISDAVLRQNGIELQLRSTPGKVVATGARSSEEVERAVADPRAPGPSGFIPKPMIAPRPGSDIRVPKVSGAAAVAALDAKKLQPEDLPNGELLDQRLRKQNEKIDLGERSTSAATASGHEIPDAKAPAGEPVAVANEGDARAASAGSAQQEEEPVEFNASHWLDGDLVIYGAQELEDGGILITKDQLARLRQFIAWIPA